MRKWILFFTSLLGFDIASKVLANVFVPAMLPKIFGYPYGGIPIFEISGVSFSLNTVVNSGAAWGIFQGHSGFLFLLRTLIIGALIAYLLFFNKGKSPSKPNGTPPLPLWLIVTGAIGNGIDYLTYGHVIDFFHFCFWGHSFAIFNLADCYITFGVFGLLLLSRSAKFRSV
jgi:signal peptidase II